MPKGDGTTRLILDARHANCYFVRPPKVVLPSPSHLAALRLPSHSPLYVAKLDLSNFYHQLALPEWMHQYFALPALSAEELAGLQLSSVSAEARAAILAGQSLHPCCATLPMGFSHSVFIAQAVHEHVLYRSGVLQPADNIVAILSPLVDRPLHGLYIDDTVLLAMCRATLLVLYDRVIAAYRAALLPPKISKCQPPSHQPVTVLGVDIDGLRGSIALSPARQAAVHAASASLLSQQCVSGRELSAIVGSWTWPMLLRRPLLAAFKHVYRFVLKYGDERQPLWPSARRELLCVMALAPLMCCSLRRPAWHQLIATDASLHGAGIVATRLTSALHSGRALWPLTTQPDCSLLPPSPASSLSDIHQPAWPRLAAQQPVVVHRQSTRDVDRIQRTASQLVASRVWSTVVACPWRYQQHINELELQAMLTAVRWSLSHPTAVRSQLLLLVDSSTAYLSSAKGRSSSPAMLTLLRRYAALLLAGDVCVLTAWVPSALNPADAASREYRGVASVRGERPPDV